MFKQPPGAKPEDQTQNPAAAVSRATQRSSQLYRRTICLMGLPSLICRDLKLNIGVSDRHSAGQANPTVRAEEPKKAERRAEEEGEPANG